MIDYRRVLRRWRRLDVVVRDLPPAVLMVAVAVLGGDEGMQPATRPSRALDEWDVLIVVLECLPLAIRRMRPTAAIALSSLGFVLDQVFA